MEYKAPPAPLSIKPVDYMTTGKAIQEGVQNIGTSVQKGLEAASSAFSQRDFKMYQRDVKQKLAETYPDFKELVPDAYMKPDQVIEGLKNIEIMDFLYNKVKAVNPNAKTGSMGALASMAYYGTKDDVKKLSDSLIAQLPEEERKIAEEKLSQSVATAAQGVDPAKPASQNYIGAAQETGLGSKTQTDFLDKGIASQNTEAKLAAKQAQDEANRALRVRALNNKISATAKDQFLNEIKTSALLGQMAMGAQVSKDKMERESEIWRQKAVKANTDMTMTDEDKKAVVEQANIAADWFLSNANDLTPSIDNFRELFNLAQEDVKGRNVTRVKKASGGESKTSNPGASGGNKKPLPTF